MSLNELDVPIGHDVTGVWSRIKRSLGSQLRTMQYARMMQIMSELSDHELEALGIDRSDIPHHAYECIYGTQA